MPLLYHITVCMVLFITMRGNINPKVQLQMFLWDSEIPFPPPFSPSYSDWSDCLIFASRGSVHVNLVGLTYISEHEYSTKSM